METLTKNKRNITTVNLNGKERNKLTWLKENTDFQLSATVRKMIRRKYDIEKTKLEQEQPI